MVIGERESVGRRPGLPGRLGVWGGILGAVQALVVLVALLVVGAAGAARYSHPFGPGVWIFFQVTFAVQHLLVLVGVLALAGVVRRSRTGRAGLLVAAGGLALLAVTELVAISAADAAVDDPRAQLVESLYGVPTVITGLGLVVGGTAIARSGVLAGWRRWIVLLTGVFVVALIPALMGPDVLGRIAIGVWMLLFTALAAASSEPAARVRASSAAWLPSRAP